MLKQIFEEKNDITFFIQKKDCAENFETFESILNDFLAETNKANYYFEVPIKGFTRVCVELKNYGFEKEKTIRVEHDSLLCELHVFKHENAKEIIDIIEAELKLLK